MINKKILIGVVLALIVIVSAGVWTIDKKIEHLADSVAPKVGNAVFVQRGCFITSPVALSAATTGVSYMTAGKATTTLACDMYSFPGSGQGIAQSAVLALQQAGTSTASIVDMNVEYSIDGVDWYQDALSDRSTTTPQFNGLVQTFRNQFASSTAGLPAFSASSTATTTKMFTIKVPTRYVRVVFTVPVGSPASAIWAELIALKQVQN